MERAAKSVSHGGRNKSVQTISRDNLARAIHGMLCKRPTAAGRAQRALFPCDGKCRDRGKARSGADPDRCRHRGQNSEKRCRCQRRPNRQDARTTKEGGGCERRNPDNQLHDTVHPQYRHDQQGRERQIVGFTATNMVHVELKQIEKASGLIDMATQTGANQVHGIQFTLRDEQAARARALQQAAKKAMASAQAMATAVGARQGAQCGRAGI